MKRVKDDTVADIKEAPAAYETGGVRTTGRVKKPKTVFDPSDNYVSRAQRTAAAATAAAAAATATVTSVASNNIEQEFSNNVNVTFADTANPDNSKGYDLCCKCQKSEPKRGQGFKSKFLTCKTCTKKWHIHCVPIDFENLSLARKKYKCENCRSCCICMTGKGSNTTSKNKDLIVCCVCVDAFHVDCHFQNAIKLKTINERTFICSKCAAPTETCADTIIQGSINTASPPSSILKPNQAKQAVAKSMKITDENKPDDPSESSSLEEGATGILCHIDINQVKDWTVDEVVKFFTKHYPKEANIFHEQDIDGASLLLLKRRDIIKRFNLKLGPSLRIYELVSSLQSKKDIVQNAWND